MTVNEAIDRLDAMRPNAYTREDKLGWLSTLDGLVFEELVCTHEREGDEAFEPYSDADGERVLLAPPPYDDMYARYMLSQIDFHNAEFERYNSTVMLFNAAYRAFADHYNRTHEPLQANRVRLPGRWEA